MDISSVSYKSLLSRRGFVGLLLSASLGRLAAGLIPFGLTAVYMQEDEFLSAGVASICFMFASSLTAPVRGRIIDRYSPKVILPVMTFLTAISLFFAFVLLRSNDTIYHGTFFVLIASAVAPLNSVVLRSTWSIVAPNEDERRALHALDSILEESVFVCSPLLVAVLWSFIGPQWAILLGSATVLLGTLLLFYFAYRSGPQVIDVFEAKTLPKVVVRYFKKPIAMTAPGLVLSLPMLSFAFTIGFCNIAFSAWSSFYSTVAFTGVLAAVTSVGGIVGGLIYGKLKLSDRHAGIAYFAMPCLSAIFISFIAFSTSSIFSLAIAFVVGLAMTPMFIAAFVRVPKAFARENINEANASIGATYNVGSGIGALLAGYLIETYTLSFAFYTVVFFTISTIALAVLIALKLQSRQPVTREPKGAIT
ncbi:MULTISPECIES: MFS transporter [Pseudomonas]|uniref:MFS transporter n=1 Tax=Pseudomonas TaxID=286 RepID=UPI00117B61C0|nr:MULTISPECIES: MFS transporter [Pseudomonas]